MKTKTFKWSVMTVLMLWGFISFIVVAGDEDPENPMPLIQFFVVKMIGMLSLAACFMTGKLLDKKGWLPEMDLEDE